ncbi:hypothetical protein [Candidatus Liberibacter sp.]|uniref:hypothetical protein n=1 Tax=Candidatus Liberibacter sp. TaxID=34022 RepID=UPI0015F71052|nr:hypothetical protein [Candidatus Liberibacter sp.]MBA5724298.1 hypothetical protein [Candidatus Liberibacter sp.]
MLFHLASKESSPIRYVFSLERMFVALFTNISEKRFSTIFTATLDVSAAPTVLAEEVIISFAKPF